MRFPFRYASDDQCWQNRWPDEVAKVEAADRRHASILPDAGVNVS
jgi:hypothetical protein